jgi:hypothetical protein
MTQFPEPYPLYWQPDEFKHEFDRERAPEMARKHYEWFITNCHQRVPVLLHYFSYSPSSDTKNDLYELGKKVASCIDLPWCISESTAPLMLEKDGATTFIDQGPSLTPSGRSLAIDMGIYLAQALLNSKIPNLRWVLVKKPKSDINFQSAVITCGPIVFEPKRGSIGTLSGVMVGKRDASTWLEIYNRFETSCSS